MGADARAAAAWWLWDDLPDDLRDGVRRVVAHEADRFAEAAAAAPDPARHQGRGERLEQPRSSVRPCCSLPDDPRRPGWEQRFQKWAMSSFLRPADAKSQTMVDGRTVAEQFTGANIYDDFTLENHGFVHPDYMTCFSLSLGAAGRLPPERPPAARGPALQRPRDLREPQVVRAARRRLRLSQRPGLGAVPQRRLGRTPHVQMAVFARDPDAWSLAGRSLDTLEKMQARSAVGRGLLAGRVLLRLDAAQPVPRAVPAWLDLQWSDDVPDESDERRGVRRLDSGKIILHRTPTAIHSVSWGAKVMAQCVPYRADRIVSPDQRNGIGQIRSPAAATRCR